MCLKRKIKKKMHSMLYSVATPIGNREDITLRALRILREVDFILCEDTRVTHKLLGMYDIKKECVSCHHHSSSQKIEMIIERLKNGEHAALVTDAGTPGISDPGNIFVHHAIMAGIEGVSVPGPRALSAALSVAGIGTDRFVFWGFIPHKKGRKTFLANIAESSYPAVFYESCHRIKKTLNELKPLIGDRHVIVCRELTKMFETVYRGTIEEIVPNIVEKGEFVVILALFSYSGDGATPRLHCTIL